jgi:hypothetical protein
MHHGEGEAGIDSASIHVDRAGPALAVIASLFGSKKTEIFAQGVEQSYARFDLELMELSVDFQLNWNRAGGIRDRRSLR